MKESSKLNTVLLPPSFPLIYSGEKALPPLNFQKKKKERVIEHANLALILA